MGRPVLAGLRLVVGGSRQGRGADPAADQVLGSGGQSKEGQEREGSSATHGHLS